MNRHGFIISTRADLDLGRYQSSDFAQKNKKQVIQLREFLPFIEPKNYRGTGRETFSADPFYLDNRKTLQIWQEAKLETFDSLHARKKIAELQYLITPNDTIEGFTFNKRGELNSVFELIENQQDYERIEICENFVDIDTSTLGFDVGYWAADYSVIADTAIKPMWHPPNFGDMANILEHMKLLNSHCLFTSYEQAKQYRETYLTKEWGEKEGYEGEITIIQVRSY